MIQHHRLLQRQLKKLGLQHTGQTPTPEQWTGLLERVSHAYDEADQERYLHERSAEISSREIQAELEIRTAAVRALRDALKGLFPESSLGPFAASDTDLGAVSRLVADLVREREASRRELDNRIFALDQHANVSIADADGVITYVNERFVDISGYSAAELVGANHRITSSGLHPPEFYREMWQTIAAGRVWHGEIVNRHKNGSLYWVATTIVPWLDPQGRPYQYIAIRTDITRQKEVEAEYRKLALIAARTDNAVVLTDAAGLVVWVNEGFTRLTGYALDEVLGRTPGVVLQGPGTDAGTVRRMAEQLRKGEAFSEEVLNYTKDGRPYWVALEVQPIRDDHGEVVNFMAIESDITERRATRQRLALQFEVSSVLAASDDLTPALGRVLRVICEGLGWQVGQVWGVADEGLRLVETWHAASVEVGDFVAASHELSCASGEGWIGRVWATGTPSWIADVANDASFRRALPATRAGLHGAFSFQVPVRGATWGVAEFFSTKIERPDEALLATLATIGVQIGEFIARRQAQEALLGAEERYRLALEGADLGTWDLHVPSGASTLNDNYFEMHGYAPGEIDTGFDTWQRLLHPDDAARVVEQFGAHLRGENEAFESEYRMHLKSGGWGWFLDRGRVIERDVEGRPVRVCGTHLDITLRKVAEKALLEEKRLLEEARRRELQTGHEIQRSLLIGETPSGIPGADIAGYAVPSRGIDGDFYAFTRFRPDCFELLVGDVMGKGVPAALVGAAIHTAYHQVVAELTATSLGGGELPRPADIVNALHARLTPRLIELETFATLALYRFDLARGELTYVNAGHTPGLLLRGAGDINRILGANVPVGTLEDERYVEAMQPISPGDALLVYSDGITEARNIADAEFGEERLRSFLLSLLRARAVPARIALQALRKRVHDYAGERALADDETAVMIGLFGRPDTVETAFSPAGDGETFDLPWDFAGFEPLRRRVAAAASRLGPDAADRLVLASFEAATNVVRHVARPFPDATLCCRLRPGRDELTVELWYVGLPFEPEPEHVPDLSGESEGGFGLHIIDHAVSRVSYEQPVLDVCCTRLVQSVAEQAAA